MKAGPRRPPGRAPGAPRRTYLYVIIGTILNPVKALKIIFFRTRWKAQKGAWWV